jgi:peptide/nickel transport system substrate-binding protein
MAHHSLLKPRWFLLCPLLILLVMMAVACGGDTTPTPEPTSVPPPEATQPAAPTVAAVATAQPAPSGGIDPVALAAKFGEKPRYGGIFLNAVIENLPHHDFHQGVGSNIQTQMQLYNGLLMTNPYDWQEIVRDLAHSWEASSDGMKYTFFLEENVKWHDGAPFSSADVKYTFDRILHKGKVAGNDTTGNFRNALWIPFIESFEAPDANTVVVNLKGPTPLVLKIFSDGYASIIPKHISEVDPINALKEDRKPIGTGPFKLTEEPSTVLWKYERNPNYFKDGLPFLDGLESHIILDIQTRATAVLTENVFWTDPTSIPQLPVDLAESIAKQDSGIVHESIPNFLFNFFAMNTTRPPFDDVRVRQAFSEALDREQFLIGGLGNQKGVIGTALFPGGAWAMPQEMREELIGYGPDMEKRIAHAKDLLAEYEAEKGEIDWGAIQYQIATQHISETNGQIVQALMKKVDVDLVLKPVETITAWTNQVDGDFNMSGMIGAIDFDDPTEAFSKNYVTGAVYGFHRNFTQEMDDLYSQQLFTSDPEERKKIAWEVDRLAMNDSGTLILLWTVAEQLRRDYVKGWRAAPGARNTVARMEYVWLDKPEFPFSR